MNWQTFIDDDGYMYVYSCDEDVEQENHIFVGTPEQCAEYLSGILIHTIMYC
jgi:hypothetical protein